MAKSTLRAFWTRYPDARKPLQEWYDTAEDADWQTLADVRVDYPKTDFVKANNGDKLIFDIGGNKYRLVCRIEFGKPGLLILFVGTHAEYDRLTIKEL